MPDAHPPMRESHRAALAVAPSLVGLALPDAWVRASEHGLLCRVVKVDGVPMPHRQSLRPGRLNMTVAAGVVTDIRVE